MNDTSFTIEEIRDIEAAWPEMEPLFEAQARFHGELQSLRLLDDWSQRQLKRLLAIQEPMFLIARMDGRAVGVLNARIDRDPGIYEDTSGYVENIYVDERARGRGVAVALLARAEAWFRANGIVQAHMGIHYDNEVAFKVWTRAGYRPEGYRMLKNLDEVAS